MPTAEDKRLQANRRLIDIHDRLIEGFRRKGRVLIDEREQWVLDQLAGMTPDNFQERLAALEKLPAMTTNRLARLLRQYFIEAMAQSAWAAAEEMGELLKGRPWEYDLAGDLRRSAGKITARVARAIQKVVKKLLPGAEAYAKRLAKEEDQLLLVDAKRIVGAGFENGQTLQEITAALRDKFGQWRHSRLDTIAETEITKSANKARVELFKASGQIHKYQFVAILDSRTTKICRARHLKVIAADDPRMPANQPPLHFRCRSILSPVFGFEELSANWSDEFTPPMKGFGG